MERDELSAWLRLTLTPGVGNVGARQLLTAFGLPQAIFDQPATALRQVVDSGRAEALLSRPEALPELLQTTWSWLQQQTDHVRHQIVTVGDPNYPAALLQLDDPPLLLYLLGSADFGAPGDALSNKPTSIDPQTSLAIVGSRNPTPQGVANARQFAKALAQVGLTIVSGMALGVDAAAHEGALEAQGSTVAVVGTGLDRVYPKVHHKLAHRIASRGLLVSEYPLGTPPLTANFPRRNRLIAGLANGTLVVEAALQSGSLITARLSAEQGKEVFAIPGSIHSTQSRGCHALIKQGAKLVESAQDVLEELRWPTTGLSNQPTAGAGDAHNAPEPLFSGNAALLQAIGFDVIGLDALQARTGLDTPTLQAHLMALEIDGVIAHLPGGLFQRQVG
ncbi:MAG: DNA-processing protein DprA [Rhodoferax sp.]|nr:DNA-processing protein DprA [Rhodoferax sp.]